MKNPGKSMQLIIMIIVAAVCSGYGESEQHHRVGGGIHYWKTIDELKDEHQSIDDSGIAWVVSYQYAPGLIKIEADLEIFPNGYGGSEETTLSPQAFIELGSAIYAAVGIGTVYANDLDKTFSDPIYILRVGLDLELLPRLFLDINGNYYFTNWEEWNDVDTDTITLGAQVRVAF